MEDNIDEHPRLLNYPTPRQGPNVPFHVDGGGNSVLRGTLLAVVTKVITSSTLVQSVLWKANKFEKLKEIKQLQGYEPRYDPTVAPAAAENPSSAASGPSQLPAPRPRDNAQSYYTCSDYHALYKSGTLTPVEVVEALLPTIRRDTTPPGKQSVAFLESKIDLVKKAAQASTERYQQGHPLSVLDGVPVAVKDEVDLTGYKRTLGSKSDFTNPLDQTAWCVQKWEEAGAVVIGKTNMHEIGLDTSNNNPNTGTPLNPHNTSYYTGGSSGGSAYAVAAGLCPVALGVDGGGSIRLPASFCGVYGLKPSHGRVSGHPTNSLGFSVGAIGPIAASIDDLALGYRIMAQPDSMDRLSALFPNPMLKELAAPKLQKKYLGIQHDWVNRSDPAVKAMFNQAVSHFVKTCGYEVIDISIPFLPQGQKAHALTILSEIRSGLTPWQISQLTYPNQLLLTVAGSHATCQDFLACQRIRDMLMRHLAWLWKQHPGMLLVTPTTPCAGWKIGNPGDVVRGSNGVSDGDMTLKTMEYVWMANYTGIPSISCPMGYAEGNVPVGIMAAAEWGQEEQLLAWGKEAEGLLGEQGVKRPQTDDGIGSWVDVVSLASGK